MKRLLIVVGLCALAVAAWGYDLSQITYLRAELPSNGPIIQIPSMKEFIQVVEATKVPFVYRVAAAARRQFFAFVADGAVYRIDSHGFRNLVDAQKAAALGFSNNGELQVVERFGIKNLDSIFYVNSEYFASAKEYRAAMNGGFRGSSAGLRTLLLPERISARDFSDVLLPQIAWYFLSLDAAQPERFGIPQGSTASASAAGSPPFVALAVIFGKAGLRPGPNWSWVDYHAAVAKLDASPAFRQWATELLGMYSVDNAGGLVAAASDPRDLDLMRAMASLGIRPSSTSSAAPGEAVTAAMGSSRGTARPSGKLQGTGSMRIAPRFPADSLVFAAARLFGMTTAAEYLSHNEVAASGYRSAQDQKAAAKGGFSFPEQYYSARRIGVATLSNYETVRSAKIRTPGTARRYLALIAELKRLQSQYDTAGPNQLAVAYVLNSLPTSTRFTATAILGKLRTSEKSFLLSTPHSMDLFSRAAHMVAGTLQSAGGSMQVTDLSEYSEIPFESGLRELAYELRNAPWISSIGSYDPATSTFVRS